MRSGKLSKKSALPRNTSPLYSSSLKSKLPRESRIPQPQNRFLAVCFAVIAGYVDANTFIRFKTFGGMMTGNTIKLAINLQQAEWMTALGFACTLLCFVVGGITMRAILEKGSLHARHKAAVRSAVPGARAVSLSRSSRLIALFAPPLMLFACLVLCDGLTSLTDDKQARALISSLAAAAMGGQNMVSSRAPSVAANTTFLTGTLKRLSDGIYAWAAGELKAHDHRAIQVLAICWLFNMVGAIAGAALAYDASWTSFSLAPAAVALAALSFHLRWKEFKSSARVAPRRVIMLAPPAAGAAAAAGGGGSSHHLTTTGGRRRSARVTDATDAESPRRFEHLPSNMHPSTLPFASHPFPSISFSLPVQELGRAYSRFGGAALGDEALPHAQQPAAFRERLLRMRT